MTYAHGASAAGLIQLGSEIGGCSIHYNPAAAFFCGGM